MYLVIDFFFHSNHPNLASSGGVCSCSDNMDKDLDELIFCIMMLVVEGRSSNGSKFQHGESIHAKPLIDNLIKKVLCLNQMAAAGTSAAKVVSDARYLVPSKLTNVSLQQQLDCHGTQTEHVCSNRLNTQVSSCSARFGISIQGLDSPDCNGMIGKGRK